MFLYFWNCNFFPILEHCASYDVENDSKNDSGNDSKIKYRQQDSTILFQQTFCKSCNETLEAENLWVFNCGHIPFCEKCSRTILASENPKCPVCQFEITSRISLQLWFGNSEINNTT